MKKKKISQIKANIIQYGGHVSYICYQNFIVYVEYVRISFEYHF